MIEIDHIRNISEIEEEIISEFSLFDEWLKYEYLIELGKSWKASMRVIKRTTIS